jgi:hypothetical protein
VRPRTTVILGLLLLAILGAGVLQLYFLAR